MPTRASVALVIDASVARAAGETEHPISTACRTFLQEVREICHRIVMTQDIYREWREHGSRLATGWLASMNARRKVIRPGLVENAELRQAIRSLDLGESREQAILRDIHLVEAALATGKTIVSNDDTARRFLREIAGGDIPIKLLIWVNPTNEDEHAVEWLRQGARAEAERQLGFG